MTPEQVLRIRKATDSSKEGFIRYLNQLVDDVENRLTTTGGDEREAALRTIERRIVPEVREHSRQQNVNIEKALVQTSRYVAKDIGTTLSARLTPWSFMNYTGAADLLLSGADSLVENKLPRRRSAGRWHSGLHQADGF